MKANTQPRSSHTSLGENPLCSLNRLPSSSPKPLPFSVPLLTTFGQLFSPPLTNLDNTFALLTTSLPPQSVSVNHLAPSSVSPSSSSHYSRTTLLPSQPPLSLLTQPFFNFPFLHFTTLDKSHPPPQQKTSLKKPHTKYSHALQQLSRERTLTF